MVNDKYAFMSDAEFICAYRYAPSPLPADVLESLWIRLERANDNALDAAAERQLL